MSVVGEAKNKLGLIRFNSDFTYEIEPNEPRCEKPLRFDVELAVDLALLAGPSGGMPALIALETLRKYGYTVTILDEGGPPPEGVIF